VNPYPDRIEELHQWLEHKYSHRDRQATEILLTAMLPESQLGSRRPWFIIETDYPNRDTRAAWFSFGGALDAKSLSDARIMHWRMCDGLCAQWLDNRSAGLPGVFVEAEWRKLISQIHIGRYRWHLRRNYVAMMYTCLRLRVAHPRGMQALLPDRAGDHSELARLTRRVLDPDYRPNYTGSFCPPPGPFLFWCELLQKLSPHFADWETLTGSLAAVARGVSVLYADGRPPDWMATDRVMRDSINHVTTWIMQQSALLRSKGMKAHTLFDRSGHTLDQHYIEEIRRLKREEILLVRERYKGPTHLPWRHRLGAKEWHEIIDREKPILVG